MGSVMQIEIGGRTDEFVMISDPIPVAEQGGSVKNHAFWALADAVGPGA